MSKQEVKRFYDLIEKDANLKKRFLELDKGDLKGSTAGEQELTEFISQKVIPLAEEYGFKFTKEEILDLFDGGVQKLSIEDISQVSGGFSPKYAILGLSAAVLMGLSAGAASAHADAPVVSVSQKTDTRTPTASSLEEQKNQLLKEIEEEIGKFSLTGAVTSDDGAKVQQAVDAYKKCLETLKQRVATSKDEAKLSKLKGEFERYKVKGEWILQHLRKLQNQTRPLEATTGVQPVTGVWQTESGVAMAVSQGTATRTPTASSFEAQKKRLLKEIEEEIGAVGTLTLPKNYTMEDADDFLGYLKKTVAEIKDEGALQQSREEFEYYKTWKMRNSKPVEQPAIVARATGSERTGSTLVEEGAYQQAAQHRDYDRGRTDRRRDHDHHRRTGSHETAARKDDSFEAQKKRLLKEINETLERFKRVHKEIEEVSSRLSQAIDEKSDGGTPIVNGLTYSEIQKRLADFQEFLKNKNGELEYAILDSVKRAKDEEKLATYREWFEREAESVRTKLAPYNVKFEDLKTSLGVTSDVPTDSKRTRAEGTSQQDARRTDRRRTDRHHAQDQYQQAHRHHDQGYGDTATQLDVAVGLPNRGNWCFVNTAIQQLFTIKPFVKAIVEYHREKPDPVISTLQKIFKGMIEAAAKGEKTYDGVTIDDIWTLVQNERQLWGKEGRQHKFNESQSHDMLAEGDTSEIIGSILMNCAKGSTRIASVIEKLFGGPAEEGVVFEAVAEQYRIEDVLLTAKEKLGRTRADWAILSFSADFGGQNNPLKASDVLVDGWELVSMARNSGAHWVTSKKVGSEWYTISDAIISKNKGALVLYPGLYLYRRATTK